jgi:DNA-binding IclR family transcriptional regulator
MTELRLIQSLTRAGQIIDYIGRNDNLCGLSEISRGIELSKTTAHGLISTLVYLGYLEQDQATGKYKLGLKLFELGQIVHNSMDLRGTSLPHLKELVNEYQETAHLAVLSGTEVIYIDKVDSQRSVRIISHVGGRNPAYCTGVGKVMLAHLNQFELERVLQATNFKQLTPRTITDKAILKRHLESVLQKGYAFDSEEIEQGLSCVAAPVKDHSGRVIAAISISGPTNRVSDDQLQQLAKAVVSTAGAISRDLGYKAQALR